MSSDDLSEDTNGGPDGEGVWSPDIEQSFQEALLMYPPCGRRKIIINDDAGGKMYGRNELIARYIKVRTGKTRSRKQVSSHIQVLARRKAKEVTTRVSSTHPPHNNNTSIDNGDGNNNNILNSNLHHHHNHLLHRHQNQTNNNFTHNLSGMGNNSSVIDCYHPDMLRVSSIASQKLRLIEFSAFLKHRNQNDNGNSMVIFNNHPCGHSQLNHYHQSSSPLPSGHEEHNNDNHFFIQINQRTQTIQNETIDILQILDKFPNEKGGLKDLYDQGPKDAFFLVKCWGDLNEQELESSSYRFSSHFESNEDMTIFCSTKVCSFGKVAAELDEKQKAVYKNGLYSYYFHPQTMCNYMVEFIRKLRELPEIDMMNSVLENFTILKVVKDHATQETLLCIAFIFEVSQKNGATHNIYKLNGM